MGNFCRYNHELIKQYVGMYAWYHKEVFHKNNSNFPSLFYILHQLCAAKCVTMANPFIP